MSVTKIVAFVGGTSLTLLMLEYMKTKKVSVVSVSMSCIMVMFAQLVSFWVSSG